MEKGTEIYSLLEQAEMNIEIMENNPIQQLTDRRKVHTLNLLKAAENQKNKSQKDIDKIKELKARFLVLYRNNKK